MFVIHNRYYVLARMKKRQTALGWRHPQQLSKIVQQQPKFCLQAQFCIFEKVQEDAYASGNAEVRWNLEVMVPSVHVGRIIGRQVNEYWW